MPVNQNNKDLEVLDQIELQLKDSLTLRKFKEHIRKSQELLMKNNVK